MILDMTLSDEIVDLLSDRFDLATRLGSASETEGVISKHVGQFKRWVVASPAAYCLQILFPQHAEKLNGSFNVHRVFLARC